MKNSFEYLVPIKDGKFKQDVQLFNGKGKYEVSVNLPSDRRENRFENLTKFEVTNVNPEIKRDILKRKRAYVHRLQLDQPTKGIFKKSEFFNVSGTVENEKK